jgi:putative chitinase
VELSDLRRALPNISADRLRTHGPALLAAMEGAGITTPLRQAHFLAQIGHECGDLRWLEEFGDGTAYEGRRDLGNTEPGDGRRFKGRGLIQVTGRANYKAFGTAIGRDLLAEPGQVSADPELAVRSATWYWSRRALNKLADQDMFESITRAINGGTNGIEDRRKRLAVAKAALGVTA